MKKITFVTIFIIFCFNITVFANTSAVMQATNVLTKMKIVIGNDDGDLMLDNNLTRAEFATIITRLLGLESSPTPQTSLTFTDVTKDFWGYNAIYKCVDKGYLLGNGDGTFRPNDPIKYEEVLTIMLRILNQDFDLTSWPDDYIEKANNLHINENTNYKKGNIINRANSFVIIYNCLKLNI